MLHGALRLAHKNPTGGADQVTSEEESAEVRHRHLKEKGGH